MYGPIYMVLTIRFSGFFPELNCPTEGTGVRVGHFLFFIQTEMFQPANCM